MRPTTAALATARHGPTPLVIALAALAAARVALGVLLWEPGWSALTWDDFTRVALGIEWAADPFLTITDLIWLPLQTWVYGIVWWAAGGAWPGSPMALFAAVNTVAAFATAGLVGWTAWRLFRSRTGAVVAYAVVLFSPWVVFTSLSGLNESLWYMAVAGSVAGLVGWLQTGSRRALALGALAVAAGAGLRYDGWTWAVAWLAVVAAWQLGLFAGLTGGPGDDRPIQARLAAGWATLAIAAAPLLVPAGYVLVNLVETGNPLHFAEASTDTFVSAFGTLSPRRRLTYYPGALVRSAPVLLPALAALAALTWRRPLVRMMTGLVVLQFGLFYAPSLVSSAVGAFAERFMFALVLAVAPLLGALPALLRRLGPRLAWGAAAALAALAIAVGAIRTADAPGEWTHAPDLLELNATLGRAAAVGDLGIALGAGMEIDAVPIATQNGDRVQLTGPAEADIVVERLPARVGEIAAEPDAVIGRYHLYGEAARRLDVDTATCGCEGWVVRDDTGDETAVAAGPYMALEFAADDPPAGSQVVARRTVAQAGEPQVLGARLRWLYGQGFNVGRFHVEVRVDGEAVFTGRVGERSRWIDVEYAIPAGDGESVVEIAVVAQPGIEPGWGWGRNSAVLVTAAGAGR